MDRISEIDSLIEQCKKLEQQINANLIWNLNDGINLPEGIKTSSSNWKIFCNDIGTYFSMFANYPSSKKYKPIFDTLCTSVTPIKNSTQIEEIGTSLHRLRNEVKIEEELHTAPMKSYTLTEEIIYTVLSALRDNPKVKSADLNMSKEEFNDALEIIDDEKLAKGIRISRDGVGRVYVALHDTARITLEGIQYLDSRTAKDEPKVVSDENSKPTVFLSYSWANDSLCDSIENFLKKKGLHVSRDIHGIGNWNSIKKFMKQIRQQDYVVLLISDEYLKSGNCMYEVTELIKDENYKDKIFPVVIETSIYDPSKRVEYVKYWEDQKQKLENVLSTVSTVNRGSETETLRQYAEIALNIGSFLKDVADMNNPQIVDVNEAIWDNISKNINV